jgi:hypothetical protein
LNKLTVSLRDKPVVNADGSSDFYFSHDKPAGRASGELASDSGRRFHPDAAYVLALRDAALATGWNLVATAGQEARLNVRMSMLIDRGG